MAILGVETKEKLRAAIEKVEDKLFNIKFAIKQKFDLFDPVHITPFNGFSNGKDVFIKGRVIEKENIKTPQEVDGILENIHNVYLRYESDEIPGVKVKITINGEDFTVETDEEGYFELTDKLKNPLDIKKVEHEVEFELLDTITENDITKAKGKIFTPHNQSKIGIISDIDDTVIISKATQFLGQAKLMLQKDAREREPFPGISILLQGLEKEDNHRNPVFYVSGSEWNIYDLLSSIFEIHEIPEGVMLLRDKGIDIEQSQLTSGKDYYKVEKIRSVLKMYPDLKFICIGDSGQKDPEAYKKIADEFPDKILAIYIRDVTPDKRDKEVQKIADELKSKNIECLLMEDTLPAAEHALKQKWIGEDTFNKIKEEIESKKESDGK